MKSLQDNPVRGLELVLVASLALLIGAGAASDAEPSAVWSQREIERAERLEEALAKPGGAAVAADTLRVRLAFDAAADLDLYVTDPLQETIYFGNTPARSGGRLEGDRRCEDPAPRIETVVFAPALAGRYRVSIDHPRSCADSAAKTTGGVAVFVLEVRHGDRMRRQLGLSEPLRFEPVVLEFEVGVEAGAETGAEAPAPAPPR